MIHTKITHISDILTDEHGYTYVELELEDGTKGYYPNSVEFLGTLTVGDSVRYNDTKLFNGGNKINGLILKQNIMKYGSIKKVGEIISGENNKFYAEIELADGTKAIHITDTKEELETYTKYDRISYADVVEIKGKHIFTKLVNNGMNDADKKNISITRQSNLKLVVEIAKVGSSKPRWVGKDGNIAWELAAEEFINASELFMDYVNP